jgi:ribulose-phosphate 3-epimerase
MKAGLALNPASPVSLIEEVLDELDLILVMTVNPGFGGQDYIPAGTGKIRRIRQLLTARGSAAALEVDGGITVHTIRSAWEAGADTFVAGTAVFGDGDPTTAIAKLKQACETAV